MTADDDHDERKNEHPNIPRCDAPKAHPIVIEESFQQKCQKPKIQKTQTLKRDALDDG